MLPLDEYAKFVKWFNQMYGWGKTPTNNDQIAGNQYYVYWSKIGKPVEPKQIASIKREAETGGMPEGKFENLDPFQKFDSKNYWNMMYDEIIQSDLAPVVQQQELQKVWNLIKSGNYVYDQNYISGLNQYINSRSSLLAYQGKPVFGNRAYEYQGKYYDPKTASPLNPEQVNILKEDYGEEEAEPQKRIAGQLEEQSVKSRAQSYRQMIGGITPTSAADVRLGQAQTLDADRMELNAQLKWANENLNELRRQYARSSEPMPPQQEKAAEEQIKIITKQIQDLDKRQVKQQGQAKDIQQFDIMKQQQGYEQRGEGWAQRPQSVNNPVSLNNPMVNSQPSYAGTTEGNYQGEDIYTPEDVKFYEPKESFEQDPDVQKRIEQLQELLANSKSPYDWINRHMWQKELSELSFWQQSAGKVAPGTYENMLPQTPDWMVSYAPGLKAGQMITPQMIQGGFSPAKLASMTQSQLEMLRGYYDWSNNPFIQRGGGGYMNNPLYKQISGGMNVDERMDWVKSMIPNQPVNVQYRAWSPFKQRSGRT